MKSLSVIVLALIFIRPFVSFCQVQNAKFEWAKGFGGEGSAEGKQVVVGSDGSVYTTGYFSGTADFNPGSAVFYMTASGTMNGGIDAFISKLDAAGNFVWAKRFGVNSGGGFSYGNSISIEPSGNIVMAGEFLGSIDLDPGSAALNFSGYGSSNIFIVKLGSSGDLVWAKSIPHTSGLRIDIESLVIDPSGNIYSTGSFTKTIDFDPGSGVFNLSTSDNSSNVFLLKLFSNGDFAWAKKFGPTTTTGAIGKSITLDVTGNIYMIGDFKGTSDFDPGNSVFSLTSFSLDYNDIFVSKLDVDGNFIWAKSMGGSGRDAGNSIAVDGTGNVYTTGFYMGTADFDPGNGVLNLVASFSQEMYISKLSSSGNFIWAKSMGGYVGSSIALDLIGNIYTTGVVNIGGDFHPGVEEFKFLTAQRLFISKLNPSGNFVWAKNMGSNSSSDVNSNSIFIAPTGNIYISGRTSGSDIDPGSGQFLLSNGKIFVLKLQPCIGGSSSFSTTQCGSYNSPNGRNISFSGTYVQAIAGDGGCDSTITINLTINPLPTITSSDVSRCGSGPISLIATPSAGSLVRWYSSPNGGTPLFTGTNYLISNLSQTGFYYAEAVNSTTGCISSRRSVLATVKALPLSPGVSGDSICGQGQVSLTALVFNNPEVFWYASSSGGVPLYNGVQFGTPILSSSTYYYVESQSQGCTSAVRSPVLVKVNPLPVLTGIINGTRCGTGLVSLSASAANCTIKWYANYSGGAPLFTGSSYNPSVSATTTFYADARNNTTNCLSNPREAIVATINPIPSIQSSTGASRCGPGIVSLIATVSSGANARWFANATGGTALSSALTFETPTLTITDTFYVEAYNPTTGCLSQARTPVVATIHPIPSVTSSGSFTCGPGKVLLTSTPSAGVSKWYSSSTGGTVLVTGNNYLSPVLNSTTTYYVEAVANSCTTANRVPSVASVHPKVVIQEPLANTICQGGNTGSFSVSTTGGTPPLTFLWSNGTIGSTIDGLLAGNYRIIVTDTRGCKDTSIAVVSSNNLQAPSLNLSTVKVCNGTSPSIYNLLDNSSYTYQWSNGSTANSISISTPGSYIVTATAPNGCIKRDTTLAENYPNCGGFLELESDPIVNYFDTVNVRVKIKGGVNVFSTYANLTFDPNRMKLISNKVGNYLGNNIINTPPIVTGNTIDFGMTKTTGQPGSNGDGDVYTFRFVLTNLPDTNSVKFNATNPNSFNANFGLSNVQVYNAQGLQPASFAAVSPSILPRPIRYYVPVWPGDLNNDKIVNVVDILPIGYFYNTQGPKRPNGNFSWTGQPARLWGLDKSEINKDAYRTFADGNADGKITLSDQAPIGFNLGQTHARRAVDQLEITIIQEITAIPTLRVDIPNTPIPLASLPQNLQVDLFIGSSSDPVPNLYGIAFDLFFTPGVLNASGIIPNYDGSIFGTLGTDFTKIEDPTQISSGKYSIGMTRFNTNAVTASGQKLLSLTFPISSGIQDVNLKFVARPLSCNNPSGIPITIQGSRDSVNLGNPISEIKETKKGNRNILIYPNPGSHIINFKSDLSINEIDFIDAFGKEVLVIRNPGSPFSISDLPNGFYFIRLISTKGVETTKFVKE